MPAAFDSTVRAIVPVGTLLASGQSTTPVGYLPCDGAAVSRTTYADLFAAIGTTFGIGDGSTTFNVPTAVGRTLIGAGAYTDPVSGAVTRTLGTVLGAERHQLLVSELAAHQHEQASGQVTPTVFGLGVTSGTRGNYGAIGVGVRDLTSSQGSGSSHNNMQPSTVCNYFIKF